MLFRIVAILLLISIFIGCEDLYNQGNEISYITASDSTIKGGLEIYLKCNAKDLDKDKLSYLWGASSGTINAFEDSAVWTAPVNVGIYFITCTVSDQ